MITADQLVAHAVGDYVIQSDWMANEKTKKSIAAAAHAVSYALPFLFLAPSWKAMLVIIVTHFFIDRFRLARYVCWVKNFLAPRLTLISGESKYTLATASDLHSRPGDILQVTTTEGASSYVIVGTENSLDGVKLHLSRFSQWWHPWAECVGTGYHKDRPPWMAVWLMIIADNTMHILINALALRYL
jgi:Protein of unknown function (DUF3307)